MPKKDAESQLGFVITESVKDTVDCTSPVASISNHFEKCESWKVGGISKAQRMVYYCDVLYLYKKLCELCFSRDLEIRVASEWVNSDYKFGAALSRKAQEEY
ncbi:hypothetical protein KSS87_014816 [Heliosperma pusillum]|nr:hypothetical protein KSS87_014816 [Heliosperma pusillum]